MDFEYVAIAIALGLGSCNHYESWKFGLKVEKDMYDLNMRLADLKDELATLEDFVCNHPKLTKKKGRK